MIINDVPVVLQCASTIMPASICIRPDCAWLFFLADNNLWFCLSGSFETRIAKQLTFRSQKVWFWTCQISIIIHWGLGTLWFTFSKLVRPSSWTEFGFFTCSLFWTTKYVSFRAGCFANWLDTICFCAINTQILRVIFFRTQWYASWRFFWP